MPSHLRTLAVAVAVTIAAGCGPAAQASGDECRASAQKFWTDFRGAAVAGDAAKMSAMTAFPLAVEGQLDEAGPPLSKAEFEQRAGAVLAADSGLRESAYPVAELVRDTAQPPDLVCTADAAAFRVGSLAFERSGGEWKLVKIFTE